MVAVSCPVGLPKTDEPAAATSAAHSSGASVGYTSGGGVANGLGNGGGLASSSIGSTHHDTACVWKYLADLSSVRHLPYDDGSSAGADASTNLSGPGGSAVTMNDGATDDGMRADEEQVLYEGAVVVVARRSTPGKPVLPEAAGKLLQRKENGTWDVQLIDANGKKYYDVAPTVSRTEFAATLPTAFICFLLSLVAHACAWAVTFEFYRCSDFYRFLQPALSATYAH
mmetsp:Transcript_73944/g.211096  ORF Transcript_73944/g.211096 Transcript_73944/m.211096 type:complete len:227 (-) Transcript_73944:1333-2013(-)